MRSSTLNIEVCADLILINDTLFFFFSFFLLIVIAHTCSTVLYPVTNFAGFDYLSFVLSIVASGAQICVLPHAPEIHLVTVSKN